MDSRATASRVGVQFMIVEYLRGFFVSDRLSEKNMHHCPEVIRPAACRWWHLNDRNSYKIDMTYYLQLAANSSHFTVHSHLITVETKFKGIVLGENLVIIVPKVFLSGTKFQVASRCEWLCAGNVKRLSTTFECWMKVVA